MTTMLATSVESLVSRAWPQAADAALKGAVILVLAALAARLMARQSAAARHAIWALALAALLALPVLSAAGPAWHVLPAGAWPELAADATEPDLADLPAGDAARAVAFREPAAVGILPPAPVEVSVAPVEAAEASSRASWFPGLATCLAAAWLLGVAACLARLVLAHASLWRLARRSRTVTDPSAVDLVRRISRQQGLTCRVCLVESAARSMPMIWGLLRPTLLVPAESRGWSISRWQAVLAHELAHARRRDSLLMLIGQAACACHWFNPLAWRAMRKLELEAESACDDRVLQGGQRASDYAVHVLELATGRRSGLLPSAGIAMAGPSDVEGRVRSILDGGRNRRVMTAVALALVAAAVAIVVVVISALRSPSPATEEVAAPVASQTAEPGAERSGPAAQSRQTAETPAAASPSTPSAPESAESAALPTEAGPLPTTRAAWIARLAAQGDEAEHLSQYSSGTTEAVWRLDLTDDQARQILAIEDQLAPLFKATSAEHHAIQQPLMEKARAYQAEEDAARKAGQSLSEATIKEAQAAWQAWRDSRAAMWRALGDIELQWYNAVGRVLTREQLQRVPAPRGTGS
jgi:beta-lactamase regulating signal transducer with metallopeptidase domain